MDSERREREKCATLEGERALALAKVKELEERCDHGERMAGTMYDQLEALKVPFLKRKMTNVGNIGELVEIKHEGRRGLTVSEVWSPRDGANNQRKLTFTLDGREQSIPAPNGEFAQANIEWEDDVM